METSSQKATTKRRSPTMLLLIASLVAGFVGGRLGSSNQQVTSPETRQQIVSSEGQVISQIAKDVGQSVVSIDVTTTSTVQDFFGRTQQSLGQAAGTGVIIDEKGVIVTNKHVVPVGTSNVKVTLSDGTALDASVIARDTRNDIAFIQVKDKKGKSLIAAKLADSGKIEVGEKVVAIGNALGEFKNTVTSGIVSGYGRNISANDSGESEDLTNLIQTDAAINQGNSGGPLVNLSGEVIGINTAITSSASGQSLGFSIPVNDIKSQITSVLEKGKIERPYLGVRYQAINDRFANIYNLPVKRGAYLPPSDNGQQAIISGSPADKAGLKEKDIITKIDEDDLTENADLVTILGRHKVGDELSLTVLRDGKEQVIKVTLEAAPEN